MIHYRQYKSYADYKKHQQDKLRKRYENIKSRSKARTDGFVDEFKKVQSAHPIAKSPVLCLAARLGEEVVAWRVLGHKNSIGIDLNPGPDNPFVKMGDFHNLDFEDASFDTIYCNSVDHVFDLPKFAAECMRVLRFDGLLLLGLNVDFCDMKPEDYVKKSSKYESMAWSSFDDVLTEMSQFVKKGHIHVPLIKKTRPERFVVVLEKAHG